MSHATVRRWMSKGPKTVSPDAELVDVYEIMRFHDCRHVPVVDMGALVGIVSDRDVRHALPMKPGTGERATYGPALFGTRVDAVMATDPLFVTPETLAREAAELICRKKIGALPVVDGREVVGIVSAEDLLWAYIFDETEDNDD
ncbi:MAG: CBS domain-containing protein [Planctomycetota bacterium]